MRSETETLTSWSAGAARQAVADFVEQVVSDDVPIEERVAVFDNDGTLWCEKPMPIQADFILRRLFEMAQADPELRDRQPWKAAYERDYGWLGHGARRALRGRRHERAGRSRAASSPPTKGSASRSSRRSRTTFLRTTQHPTLGRGYLECAYAPMVELLGYLEANGFTNYIASGGGRDFMRPISHEVYGIPRERVIGSATTLEYASTAAAARSPQGGGRLPRRRPAEADPDLEPHRPAADPRRRQLQRRHPDARVHPASRTRRLCACSCCTTTTSANSTTPPALNRRWSGPKGSGWTVVSMKNDWAAIF